jgi:hypothetical protein
VQGFVCAEENIPRYGTLTPFAESMLGSSASISELFLLGFPNPDRGYYTY